MPKLRKRLEKLSRRIPPPRDNMLVEEFDADGVHMMKVALKEPVTDRTIFYLHGGGYCFCSPHTHRGILMFLCYSTGATVIAPQYRLAPEHPFPSGLDDAIAAWRWLMTQISPERVVMGGDSAGGGLTLATIGRLIQDGELLPKAAFLFSPWTDLTLSGDSIDKNRKQDVMFRKLHLEVTSKHYLNGADPMDPFISPLFLDKAGFPPVMIQVSKNELLYNDSSRLVPTFEKVNVPIILDEWNGLPHVWQVFLGRIPEARKALQKISDYICQHVPENAT